MIEKQEKMTIAVLFGGCSAEYGVSLQSASSVIEALNFIQYQVLMIGITRRGQWFRYGGGTDQILNDTWWKHESCVPAIISPDRQTHGVLTLEKGGSTAIPVDAVFPVLHGQNGEDGTLQGLLKMAGIPCVGCGMLSSAICMDKDIAHRLVHLAGIKTPRSIVMHHPVSGEELTEQTKDLKYPLFVKPANAGSSFGISKISDSHDLLCAVCTAFEHDRKVILEEAVGGFEVGCAVLGNETLTIGQVDEIELADGFFDYEEKYTLRTSKLHMPARIDQETADQIRKTAADIYRTLNCSGLARVDLFLTPEKEIIFNEVNTIPGFTSHSRYPTMMKGIGMTFPQIVDRLIRLAVQL